MRTHLFTILLFFAISTVIPLYALENIALGKPYTLEPAPEYSHCTDPEDAKQLTDGIYTEGYFWTQKSTVGWSHTSPVIITVDLGEVKPIRGLSFNTAAGAAGVEWPRAIRVLLADDDRVFHALGDLTVLDREQDFPPREGYGIHRFWTDALQTHGRYVALVVESSPFTFVDEIEVYAGDAAWLEIPLAGAEITDIKAYLTSLRVRDSIAKRMRNDLRDIRELLTESVPETTCQEITAALDALAAEVETADLEPPADFRAVLPLNPLHARILGQQARIWRASGLPAYTVWQSTSAWDFIPYIGMPPQDADASVEMRMMSGEYRAGAFQISNAGEEDAVFQLRIEGLPGGLNPPCVTVHEVAWTDTYNLRPVAAALPEATREGDAYRITVPCGLTRQVWLTFHPTDEPARRHEGILTLTSGDNTYAVPLTLHVYPVQFPDKTTLHCGGWDYVDSGGAYGITPENRGPFLEHLRAHFVDTPWAKSGVIPAAKFDTGAYVPGDTAAFDEWIALWPNAPRYYIFAAVSGQIGPYKMDDPGFDPAVQAWAQFLASHAQSKGIAPENISLLLVDEPHDNAQDAVILAWAKAIRTANTGLQIWEDPTYGDMTLANQEMVAVCHVLCPNRQIFEGKGADYQAYFAARQQEGIRLEFYSCSGPARLLDPYSYYRMQPWLCWQWNADASHFWAFGDNGRYPSWNEYLGTRNAYSPIFIEETSVTAAKEMEAIREGIEDYEYLVMLRDALTAAELKGITSPALDKARELLSGAATRVLETGSGSIMWLTERQRTEADTVRVEILEVLAALQ